MTKVPKKWIRTKADELAISQGCWVDEAAGEFVCDFIETFCKQSKGRWAGTQLTLQPWQRDFVMRLFGWKKPDGRRRFRRAYLEVAKKNGKSTLISALCLVLLLADGEGAPEVDLNAYDREQASIVYNEAKHMVQASPELAGRIKVVDSKKILVHEAGHGRIKANSADVPSKDGLNTHGTIFDELHRQRSREMWDIYEYASASREQPLWISITTAGEDESGLWYEQREYSEKVNEGIIPDTSHLGVIYRALATDNLDDPATWRKANPSLGTTISEEDFARELAEAKHIPAKLANFMRLRLNIIVRGQDKFIDLKKWDACGSFGILHDPAPCYIGVDLSQTNDLTAAVQIVGDLQDGFDVFPKFYLPEDNIVELERTHQVPYRVWAKDKLITLTPGEVIDYAFVRRDINELASKGDCRSIIADPYNATKLGGELLEQDGLNVVYVRQGFLSLNEPTKELLRLVLSKKLRHGGHPILRWHASNAVCETDAAGNIKLNKRKSRKKIDGMAALVNAIAGSLADDDGPSVYDSRGVLFL